MALFGSEISKISEVGKEPLLSPLDQAPKEGLHPAFSQGDELF